VSALFLCGFPDLFIKVYITLTTLGNYDLGTPL
jgi:hypothetical protein